MHAGLSKCRHVAKIGDRSQNLATKGRISGDKQQCHVIDRGRGFVHVSSYLSMFADMSARQLDVRTLFRRLSAPRPGPPSTAEMSQDSV